MVRPTDTYGERPRGTLQRLLVKGALLGITTGVIGALAGWTRQVDAVDHVAAPDARLVAREMGSLSDQLESARGEMTLVKVQLERANAIMANSTKYQIPADLAADIYDIALSEGIDPALGFQLVKIESSFRGTARSSMDALGYTQLQVATARFYDAKVRENDLYDRETNLRIGFRFLNDLLHQFKGNTALALVAYNRGPAKVADILAGGGDPANGYAQAVMEGYTAPGTR